MFGSRDNIILKIIFMFCLIFININLWFYLFIFSYYMCVYIILMDLLLLFSFFFCKNGKKNIYINRICVIFLIILLYLPLNCIVMLYYLDKKWMNKFIICLFTCLLILITFICFYNKFYIIFIILMTLILFIMNYFINIYKINFKDLIYQYKLYFSIVISVIIYYIENN
jgi:hypothetical protein